MSVKIGTVLIDIEGAGNTDGWESISWEAAEELIGVFFPPPDGFKLIALDDDPIEYGLGPEAAAWAKKLAGRVAIISW